ncbi:MAG: SdiA-regulated domain-containing protein [Bacteroidales bacterium]|nr:SdiA-regulated domain-containing protein [Bacteroidales bacterium]
MGCIRGCTFNPVTGSTFFATNWSASIVEFDISGNIINEYSASGLSGQFGLAYNTVKNTLLIFDQNGTQENRAIIHEYDLRTEVLTGVQYALPMLQESTYQQAGGIFYTNDMFPGKSIVGGIAQNVPNDKLFGIEFPDIESWLTITAGGNGTIQGVSEGTATMTLHFDATGVQQGETKTAWIKIMSNDRFNPEINIPVTMEVGGISLSLKAFLEGPFEGQEMKTDLNIQNSIPLTQPFNSSPWNYTGTEAVTGIPNPDIVDWVLVELRETSGGPETAISDSIIAQKAGFMLKNGNMVDVDGVSPIPVLQQVNSNLYAVLWHQNHIGIMSANPVTETGGIYNYDFTTGPDKIYGSSLGCKELVIGIWGMIGADGNADGQVSNTDKNDVWIPQAGNSGYFQGDFNMDANVNNIDKIDVWIPNGGSGSQVPDGVEGFKCMVPE